MDPKYKDPPSTYDRLAPLLGLPIKREPWQEKENSVQTWKGLLKEARAGHPNNVAFCKMLQPGLLPGMDGPQIRFIHQGNPLVGQKLAAMFRSGTDPDTLEYLHGMEKKSKK